MSIKKSIENLFENPTFAEEIAEPLNRQLYFINGKSIVRTDDGAYMQYTCYPQFWVYGAAVQSSCLQPLSLTEQDRATLEELLVTTEILNENGFAPVSIYSAKEPSDDRILVNILDRPVMMIMDSLSFSRLNETSLHHLPDALLIESDIMTRHPVTVEEDGTILSNL